MEMNRDYLVRRISAREQYADLLSFPRYFEIETVNACNARCPMCTIDDWDRRDGLMSDTLFSKIATEIIEHPEVLRVHLYRDGEPLLDKHLAQKVSILKTGGVREIGISTNVQLLTAAKSEALLNAGLDSIILSIDSLKPATYHAIRVGCDFDVVMNNAHQFIAARDKLNSHCKIHIRMIRQISNHQEWPEYEKYWRGIVKDCDRVDYRNLHNWGNQLAGARAGSDVKPCIALWSLMCIFANGDVPMCNADYNRKHSMGSIMDQSIEELWKSRIQNDRRALHLGGNRNKIDLCEYCTVWDEPA